MIISVWEYNVLSNEYAAMERVLVMMLDEKGVDEITMGNVYIYRAGEDGDRAGIFFIDEHGARVADVNYALADHGVSP